MRQYIFDGPQWQWTKAYQATEFCGMFNSIRVLGGGEPYETYINIPAEFYRYIDTIHGSIEPLKFIIFLNEFNEFCYAYNGIAYHLWNWPTLPPAFKE